MLAPLIPQHVNTHRFGGGRPRVPDRTWIFYVLRTGCSGTGRHGICSGSTERHERYDELKGLDWLRWAGGKTGPNPTDRGSSVASRGGNSPP